MSFTPELAIGHDETLVRQLLAATRDGVAITGPSGALIFWNAAAHAITGWSADEAKGRTMAAIPEGLSQVREGKWVDARRFRFHIGKDEHVALLLADTTAQVELTETVRKLKDVGLVDATTGMPGRALALDHLGRSVALAGRGSYGLGVLAIGLRPPEDSSTGAVVPAALLRQVARRLTTSTRASDFVAHTAPWSFVVVLSALGPSPDSVMVVTARLLLALAQPFAAGGRERSITTAIGIAEGPEDEVNAGLLLERAETALRDAQAEPAPYHLWRARSRTGAAA